MLAVEFKVNLGWVTGKVMTYIYRRLGLTLARAIARLSRQLHNVPRVISKLM